MSSKQTVIPSNFQQKVESIHQGDCIHIINNENLFQVVGIDNKHHKCWVREWPLLKKGSPVFEISIQQVAVEAGND